MSDAAPVERFARDLREHRAALADAVGTRHGPPPTGRDALVAAQRCIDRLIVLYVLVDRGLVVEVDEGGETLTEDPATILSSLLAGEDPWNLLNTICLDGLTTRQPDTIRSGDGRRLRVPYLTDDLFEPIAVETTDGRTVSETGDLTVDGFDWGGLVVEIDRYDWQADERGESGGKSGGPTGTLTPAVLGYLYETVVVPLRAADEAVDLDELDGLDPHEREDLLAGGNGDVGAYYTGDAIADFLARRALWEALREKIEADVAAGETPPGLDVGDLYRPASERREAVEEDQRDGFDVLAEDYGDQPAVLKYVDAKIGELRICDPSVGSGAFALAVANVLLSWRSTCRPEVDEDELRREIVVENVYGVDALAGATRICRLRLWLWVLGGDSLSTDGSDATRREGPFLPALTVNVRTGNSLLGFVEVPGPADRPPDHGSNGLTDGLADRLAAYGRDVRGLQEAGDPEKETTSGFEARRADLKAELDERYAATRRGPDGAPLVVPDHVADADAARRSLTEGDDASPTLVVEVPGGIPDAFASWLDGLGFTSYTYRARLDGQSLERSDLEALFDRLATAVPTDDWDVIVERPSVGRDFAPGNLDACHWPLAFPTVFAVDGGFDVVIGNPPYGAEVAPEAAPLLEDGRPYECQGAGDTCEWFYERALDLVHDDGIVSFVGTKSLAFYSSWADVRETYLRETAFCHVLDVGLGFGGVNLETIATVHALGGDGEASTPTVHRTADRRQTDANRPVHLGWVDQRYMRDAGTIIFRPITDDQSAVLDRLLDCERRLGDVMSTDETTRQLYVPDSEKARLDQGEYPYINKNHWVGDYYLEDVWQVDLGEYRAAVDRYAVPRVMLKVLRGSRLRAWLDPNGQLVGTEKLVNVPMTDTDSTEIAFVYAALNHPCASFYLQKAIFSETTETARVMDGQYSTPIPIPAVEAETEAAVALLAWTLTMAKQTHHDGRRDDATAIGSLESGLDATIASLYLDCAADRRQRWTDDLLAAGPSVETVGALFEEFYAARYGTADGDVDRRGDRIETVVAETAALAAGWDTAVVLDGDAMAVVLDVL